jgi:CheY-like chemotaxis protein
MNTVLVIDDNADYRASLIEILALELHTTLEAENGQVGLRMIRQYSPNLIVCDVDMPVMNGIEVLRTAKADPIYAKIPFLIITGHRDEQTLKTSLDLGVEAYLTKPIAVTEFLSTIDHFLKEKDPPLLL